MAKTPSFKTMLNKELVAAYNEMVASPAGKALGFPRNRPVTKFTNAAVGVKRCESLASSIKASNAKPAPVTDDKAKQPAADIGKHDKRKDPRANSKRQKLINCLIDAKGKPVLLKAVLKAVYGTTDLKNRSALSMCMGGMVAVDIGKRGLPYKLIKEKEGKEVTFALKKN